jgi:isocitrate lyase
MMKTLDGEQMRSHIPKTPEEFAGFKEKVNATYDDTSEHVRQNAAAFIKNKFNEARKAARAESQAASAAKKYPKAKPKYDKADFANPIDADIVGELKQLR